MKNNNQAIFNSDKETLNTRYEKLRSDALSIYAKEYTKNSQELALFLYSGMSAWAEAWGHYGSHTFPVKEKQREKEHPTQNVPVDLYGQVTILLATMALNACQEVNSYDE